MSEAKSKYLAAKAAFEETFEKHLQNGVEFISDQVFIDPEVEIAPGAVILPGCILRGKTVIGASCVIGPNTLLENTIVEAGSTVNASQCYDSHLGPNNKIGPFTHVRTGTVTDEGVHLGAYVETKNANFAEGNTVSHLTYIGDGPFSLKVEPVSTISTMTSDSSTSGPNSTEPFNLMISTV